MSQKPQLLNFWLLSKSLFFICVVWELIGFYVDSPILPMPHLLIENIPEGLITRVFFHIAISLTRLIVGLGLGGGFGYFLGLFVNQHPILDSIVSPFVFVSYPFPKIVLVPILFIICGAGEASRVALLGIIVFYQVFTSTRDGIKQMDPRYLDSFQSLGGKSFHLYQHLLIPFSLPQLLSTLKISLGSSLSVLFFAETYATNQGIGFFIWDSFSQFDYQAVYLGTSVFCLVGLALFLLLEWIETRVSYY